MNLSLMLKLYNWWNRFMSILKGELKVDPVADALTVQLMLIKLGYFTLVTGELDDRTRTALKQFQKDKGIAVDGLFGPETWKALRDATDTKP